jgi:hypothetical protein
MGPNIEWVRNEGEALRQASQRGLPVMVDFFKDG